MHNVTEGLWKSSLKIIWSTTREGWGRTGAGQKRGEETMATVGYGVGIADGGQKRGEYENQLLVFLSFAQGQILL